MVLPTFGSISISGINSCARFTDGNIGVNTTSPNYNLDINGTLKATTITTGNMLATTSISSGSVNATNSTITNAVRTNISSGTLNLSTGLTTATILATTSISSGVVNATNSTITNLVVTSNTVTNAVATNVSSATLNLSGGCTVGTARITTSLLAIGNSNTVGNIFTTGGNVGISTSSPGYTLDVNGKLQVYNNINNMSQIILSNPNSGSDATSIFTMVTDQVSTFNIFKNSTTRTADGGVNVTTIRNDGGPLRLQSNTGMGIWVGSTGNVGINTTVPSSTLDIKGGSTWGLTRLAPTTSGGETAIGFFALNDFTASTQATSGNWILGTGINIGGASNFNLFRNTTNILSVATNGNVGIGTTSPSSKLNVVGDTVIQDGGLTVKNSEANGYGRVELNGTAGSYIDFGPDTIDFRSRIEHVENTRNLSFRVNGGTYAMTLASTGNVGIGTASPSVKLHVVGGDLGVPYGQCIRASPESASVWPSGTTKMIETGWNINGFSGDTLSIYTPGSTSSTTKINITSSGIINLNGNVGIGTASPTEKLNVVGNTDLFGTVRIGSNSSSTAFLINLGTAGVGSFRSAILNGDGTNILFSNQQNGNINFGTNNTADRLVIAANGNVGVGRNNPGYKLQSTGVISVDSGSGSEARYHLYNNGSVTEWLFGQKSNTNHNFTFTRKVSATETDCLSIGGADGRVTIGGVNGSYPLTVFGSSNSGSIGGYAGWSGNYAWQNQTTSYDVSIYGQNFIMAGQGFVSVSDQRIKKDIIDIEDGESLNIIRQIQPKRYRYIDEYKRGTDYVYGFIAQQVREVLPSASGLVKDVIPSIITPATVSYDSVNDITTVSLVDNKQHNLTSENSNLRIRFFDENDTNTDLELHEIVSGNIFKVKGELKGTNTFVYGLEVEDFHTLNKDVIFTVALAALQQVDKELQETKQTVNDLLQRIQALENARN